MPARFILSFDCEGKWGVADHLTPAHEEALSLGRLQDAYGGLLALLDEFEIAATFAFVGFFTLPAARLQAADVRDYLASLAYLRPALPQIAGECEGWTGDWAVDWVSQRRGHELALHGVSHAPWTDLSRDQAVREMQWADKLPFTPQTFIYPRNRIAHADVLGAGGIAGYRAERAYPNRLISLVSEFNVAEKAEADLAGGHPRPIPAGYFVNWRSGLRKLVPIAVSRRRAANVLQDAVNRGRVAHYWTHPENIASAPETLAVLRGVLQEVSARRDKGEIVVQTQAQYCEGLSGAG